ncbi:hypothetical protein [Clostridium coskatii]|uniref:Uncharacterized protein n=1 Tax=Clostridium coskatii TaxID=1705578 RepID=A0A166RXQ4_9CLOT|nr:hypothetical protein [Clostridium coskatii]OAA91337.1 hypothetical protein WX73_01747 [Clostridium coskatii]OBR93969.1 hypothetical protein CLCOS_21050 [Clostridium coskatii]
MIVYIIMSFAMGYTGNKLFNKRNKNNKNSIKWGCIVGIALLIVYYIVKIKISTLF